MARTITQIQEGLMNRVAADPVLSVVLTSTSATAIYRLLLYIVAFCAWTLENLHDLFKEDVNETISLMKPHSTRWYEQKSKAFQYGFDLVDEADYYDNTGVAPNLVVASKIVSYAAVVEQIRGVRIKIAKAVGDDLGPLTVNELDAFKAYMKRVKDAGVKVEITSGPADALRLVLRIKRNPMILNAAGARIDGTVIDPVKAAIKDYLKHMGFNGVFSIQRMIDAIQSVEGVTDLNVDEVQTRYGILNFSSVNISMIPDAGYLRIDDADLMITYLID